MTTANNQDNQQQSSGTPSKGEELDAFTNAASKKNKPPTNSAKPQSDEILNPDVELHSELTHLEV